MSQPRPARRPAAHPHDALSRHYLASPDLGVALLRWYAPPELVALLDLDTLAFEATTTVDETLAPYISDIRYSVAFKNTNRRLNVCIFIEHQSSKNRFIAFRMLCYIIEVYRMLARAAEFSTEGEVFPYPIAIVLHHGKRAWRNFPKMSDLIQKVPGIDPNVLNFPFIIIDLADDTTDITRGPPELRAFLEALRASGKGRLKERLLDIAALLARVKDKQRLRGWTRALFHYAASLYRVVVIKDILIDMGRVVFGPREGVDMAMSALEELKAEGFREGVTVGEKKGLADGKVVGLAEGKAKGLAAGKAEAVLGILTARFGLPGSHVRKKIEGITDTSRLDTLITIAATCKGLRDFERRVK